MISRPFHFGFVNPRSAKGKEFDVATCRAKVRELAAQLEYQETNLCDLCKGVSIEKMKWKAATSKPSMKDRGYTHHASWIDLTNSANHGCRLCYIFWNILILAAGIDDSLAASLESIQDSYIRLSLSPVDRGSIFLTCGESPSFCVLALCISRGPPPGLETSDIMRSVELDPSSPASFLKVKQWLSECEQNHEGCAVSANPPLPTRVIDVGSDYGSQEPHLHLSDGHHGRYITLSHVWGKIATLTTTNNTISERIQGICLSEMPKNFRDAVIVTRRLGFQYLWIDSLCIVQDSATDWEIESAKMSAVYKNSSLTISAASAKNSHVGFLIARNPLEQLSCDLRHLSTDGGETHKIQIVWPPPRSGDNAISTRAWTLQELILSPRVVHYTISQDHTIGQMIWECQKHTEPENGSVSSIFGVYSRTIKRALKLAVEDSRSINAIYKCWYYIIRQYSTRYLSYPSDKLPALSGLATEIQFYTKDGYLAGLWEGDLARGLLWAASGQDRLQRPTEVYRAPSWSWASVEGEIYYDGVNHLDSGDSQAPKEIMLEVLDAEAKPTGLNPLGAVHTGHITMGGFLKATLFSRTASPLDRSHAFECAPADSAMPAGRIRFDELDPPSSEAEFVWCLLVSKEEHFHHPLPFQTIPNGLVLLPTTHEGMELFTRVGVFELHEGFMDWFDDCGDEMQVVTII